MNKKEGYEHQRRATVIWEIQNGKMKADVSGIWSCKFYDQNYLENRTKIFSAFKENWWKIKWFQKPEQSDEEELLKLFKQKRSNTLPVRGSSSHDSFVLPKLYL